MGSLEDRFFRLLGNLSFFSIGGRPLGLGFSPSKPYSPTRFRQSTITEGLGRLKRNMASIKDRFSSWIVRSTEILKDCGYTALPFRDFRPSMPNASNFFCQRLTISRDSACSLAMVSAEL